MMPFTIRFEPMTEAEFAAYQKVAREEYAADKEKTGLSREQARKAAEESYSKLLPQGLHTPGQVFFSIFQGAAATGGAPAPAPIGTVWMGPAGPGWPEKSAFLLDIVLDEACRGKGYGKQAMALLELEAKKRGYSRVGLHVFGHNEHAWKLYEKVGYRVTDLWMLKDIQL